MRADRLRDLRTQRGFSQEQLARLADVGHQQVWRYESGNTMPSAEIVARIARALGTSADYLLGLSDDPSPQEVRGDLSPDEEALIAAWRRGDTIGAMRIILAREGGSDRE